MSQAQNERDKAGIKFCIEHKLPSPHIANQAVKFGWDAALESQAVRKLVEALCDIRERGNKQSSETATEAVAEFVKATKK